MTLSLSALKSFVYFGWSQAWQERFVLPVQIVTFSMLIVIFSSVFLITPFNELRNAPVITAQVMIWYIIVTELVVFSSGVQNLYNTRSDVIGGQFATSLQRPRSYFGVKIWIWGGGNLVRVAVFLIVGLIWGLLITREFPYALSQLCVLVLSVYLGTLIYSAIYFILGVLEVWGPYSRPFSWINQKLAFLLGGLMLPLELYPEWLQALAWSTPYPAMLNIPASFALNPSWGAQVMSLCIQVLWLIGVNVVALVVEDRAYRLILERGN